MPYQSGVIKTAVALVDFDRLKSTEVFSLMESARWRHLAELVNPIVSLWSRGHVVSWLLWWHWLNLPIYLKVDWSPGNIAGRFGPISLQRISVGAGPTFLSSGSGPFSILGLSSVRSQARAGYVLGTGGLVGPKSGTMDPSYKQSSLTEN